MRCNDPVCHQSAVPGLGRCQVCITHYWSWYQSVITIYHALARVTISGGLKSPQRPIRSQILAPNFHLSGLVMATPDTHNLLIKSDMNLFHDPPPRHNRKRYYNKHFFCHFFELFMRVSWLAVYRIDGSSWFWQLRVYPRYSFYPPSFEDTLMIN